MEGSFDLILLGVHGHHNAHHQLFYTAMGNKFLSKEETKATDHKGQGHFRGKLIGSIQPLSLDVDDFRHPIKGKLYL